MGVMMILAGMMIGITRKDFGVLDGGRLDLAVSEK